MNERQLLEILLRLVAASLLLQSEVRAILVAFRAGELGEAVLQALVEAVESERADLSALAALAALSSALGDIRGSSIRKAVRVRQVLGLIERGLEAGGAEAFQTLISVPFASRQAIMETYLDIAAKEFNRRARIIGNFPDGIRRFEVAMRQAIREDVLAMAQLGGGAPLAAADIARIREALIFQNERLARFTREIAARQALFDAGGRAAMTELEIAARARMYRGFVRAEFYRQAETDVEPGFVIEYVSLDDNGTCSPCIDAEGFYLPGEGPLPGEVCLGHGHCRCRRNQIFDAALYAELSQTQFRQAA